MDTVEEYGIAECHYEPVALGNPAAGAGFTYSAPGSQHTTVLAVCFQLANAAVAVSRIPTVSFLDETGTPFARVAAPFTTGTGITTRYTFAVGAQQAGANDALTIVTPLPRLPLRVGLQVQIAVVAINAGDQMSAIRLFLAQRAVRDDDS